MWEFPVLIIFICPNKQTEWILSCEMTAGGAEKIRDRQLNEAWNRTPAEDMNDISVDYSDHFTWFTLFMYFLILDVKVAKDVQRVVCRPIL